MVVKYKGQKLRYVKDFHGKEVLWILNPEQIEMPGMIFEIIKRVNLIKVPHTAKILNRGCDGNK